MIGKQPTVVFAMRGLLLFGVFFFFLFGRVGRFIFLIDCYPVAVHSPPVASDGRSLKN